MKRRAFLTGVGAAGAAALCPGVASAGGGNDDLNAPPDYPAVSTRDHFGTNLWGTVERNSGKYSYEEIGDWSGYEEGGDLLLFVHGWRTQRGGGKDAGYTAKRSLAEAGYDAFGAAYTWDADKGGGIDGGWYEAEEIAKRNGPKLAAFLGSWGQKRHPDSSIKLVAHSLGGQVVCSAMRHLAGWGLQNAVDELVLLGAAVDNDEVAVSGKYGEAIEAAAGSALNCYKHDDRVLEWAYAAAEWSQAVGEQGVSGTVPSNMDDVSVTDVVPDHYSYPELKADGGCMDVVVENW